MTDRDPFIQADNDGRSAQVIQVESSRMLVPLLAVSLLAICFALMGWARAEVAMDAADDSKEEASRMEREARMLQYYVLEMDAKLIAAGFKTDAESVARKLKENSP
jgi:hypothetical protein